MKLQINDSGSWRNVVSFKEVDQPQIRSAAVCLMLNSTSKGTLRILGDNGDVLAYWDGSPRDWRSPSVPSPDELAEQFRRAVAGPQPPSSRD